MDKRSELLKLIPEQGIVPLYYTKDVDVSIEIMKALYHAGIRTTEYANRGEDALKNFKSLRKVCDTELPGMYLGVGTIKNAASALTYIDAGAEFIICPGMIEAVGEIADQHKLFYVPGCMTPTEIIRAEASGAKIIKLIPANTFGPPFLDAVNAVFSDLLFMPTGGIELNEDNLTAWFKSGVCAVGGSKLITKTIIDNKQYDELTFQAQKVFNYIQLIKDSLKSAVK